MCLAIVQNAFLAIAHLKVLCSVAKNVLYSIIPPNWWAEQACLTPKTQHEAHFRDLNRSSSSGSGGRAADVHRIESRPA